MKIPLQGLRKAIPWYVKFIIKIIRGLLPLNYSFFAKLGFFRHGKMDDPKSALDTFQKHLSDSILPTKPFVFMELGPGDSLFSGIIAAFKGASESYLIDNGDWVSKDVTKYLRMIEFLFGAEYLAKLKIENLEDIKKIFNIHHLTHGLEDLKKLPDQLIDVSFSNAVLEHVYVDEMTGTFKELRRISKNNAISSHYIDFKDHLAYSLNNLRFSRDFWERPLVKKSGIYTNRLRFSDIEKIAGETGFKMDVIKLEKWSELPLQRNKIHPSFSSYTSEELLIQGGWIRLS